MHSIFRVGIDSAKISFPSIPRRDQLSVKELKEIESAISQMELWNALSLASAAKQEASFVEQENSVSVKVDRQGERGGGEKAENTDEDYVQMISSPDAAKVPTTESPSIAVRAVEDVPRRVKAEDPSSDHLFVNEVHSHRRLRRKLFVHLDSPADASGSQGCICQPLRPLKSEGFPFKMKAPKLEQCIAPGKENVYQPLFNTRRKPVPHVSDPPSTPTPIPKEPKDVAEKINIDSFPALDSGSLTQHYQLDPEVLARPKEMRVRNLTLKRLLGFGGQGRVYIAQGPAESETKGEDKWRVYAVKVMIKSRYVQFDDILREQNLLKRLRGNRLLLQLEGSFHDRKNFYLITEYHSGGDLENLLRTRGCCSVSAARIYTAELCAAVGFLHQNFILHRDVKPSNVLIKADGHICLSDFGLAVDFSDHTTDGEANEPVIRGCAGTAMYMSPEALNGDHYGFKADWWSVGATCFNLFEGMHPWSCLEQGWLAANAGLEPVQFHVTTDIHVRSFIRALLQRDQGKRLGDAELFDQPFFDGLKIQDIYQGRLLPPYIPKPVDSQHIPNLLNKNDVIEIGGSYPEGEVPMPDYFFSGPNMPDYEPSPDEVAATELEGGSPSLPFNCSPSLYALLQESISDIASATLNNFSGSIFVPSSGQLGLVSGPTIAEEFGLDDSPIPGSGVVRGIVVRKDLKFRWSQLSIEEAQFGDLAMAITSHLGSNSKSNSPPEPSPVPGSATPNQRSGSEVQEAPKPEVAPPAMERGLAFGSPPRKEAAHQGASRAEVDVDDIIVYLSHKFCIMVDVNSFTLLSPTSGTSRNYQDDSTVETVASSFLGLGFEMELGEGDETGLTTFDFGVSASPRSGSSCPKGFGLGSGEDLFPGIPIPSVGSQRGTGSTADGSRNTSSSSSILGKMKLHEALPAELEIRVGEKDAADKLNVGVVLEPRGGDIVEDAQTSYEKLTDEVSNLIRKISQVIKKIWSRTCCWRALDG